LNIYENLGVNELIISLNKFRSADKIKTSDKFQELLKSDCETVKELLLCSWCQTLSMMGVETKSDAADTLRGSDVGDQVSDDEDEDEEQNSDTGDQLSDASSNNSTFSDDAQIMERILQIIQDNDSD